MDYGVIFLVITFGVLIGSYLKDMILYHTAHIWMDQEDQEEG